MKKRLAALIAVLMALSTFSVNAAEFSKDDISIKESALATDDTATPDDATPDESGPVSTSDEPTGTFTEPTGEGGNPPSEETEYTEPTEYVSTLPEGTTEPPESTTSAEDTTAYHGSENLNILYFVDNLGWGGDVYCYAINDDGEENAAWPGVLMNGPNYDGYGNPQFITYISDKFTSVVFVCPDSGQESPWLDYSPGIKGYYYDGCEFNYWTDESGGEGGNPGSGAEEEMYEVKLLDYMGWDNVYCRAYNEYGEENAPFPGEMMEWSGDYDRASLYTAYISEKYTKIVFSNGEDQSEEFEFYPGLTGYIHLINGAFIEWSGEGDTTEPCTDAYEESTYGNEETTACYEEDTTACGEEETRTPEGNNLYVFNAGSIRSVYCYAFNDNGAENAPFPGVLMDVYEYGTFVTKVSDELTHVIFVYTTDTEDFSGGSPSTCQTICFDYYPGMLGFTFDETGLVPMTNPVEDTSFAQATTEPDETTFPPGDETTFPPECTTAPFTTEPCETTFPTKTPDKETKPKPTTAPATVADDTEPYTSPNCTEPAETTSPKTNDQPTSKAPGTANSNTNSTHITPAKRPLIPRLNILTGTMSCGKTLKLTVLNKGNNTVKFSSSNKKVAKVSKNGLVTALRKGFAKITAKIGKNTKRYFTLKVISSPTLDRKSVKIKKGKSKKIWIYGKASSVNLKFKNTKKAKIISSKNASFIKVKAKRVGKTKVKVRVNGKWLKLKVKVI